MALPFFIVVQRFSPCDINFSFHVFDFLVADPGEELTDVSPSDGDIGVVVLDLYFADVFFGELAFLTEEANDVHLIHLVFLTFGDVEGGPAWRGGSIVFAREGVCGRKIGKVFRDVIFFVYQ